MFFEMRTYRVHPGKLPEFVKLYETEALPIITRHLPLAGSWTTESGVLNSIVFLWRYANFEDRVRRRGALAGDPDWLPVAPKIPPYLVHQESVFLRNAFAGIPS